MPDEDVSTDESAADIIEPEDGSISTDVDDPGYVPPEEGADKDTTDKKPDDKDDKEDPLKTLEKKLTDDFTAKLTEKDKEIKRLGYQLRTINKKSEGDKKEDEPTFTDAQLLAIMKEHKDDPTVMLQVMKELVKTSGKDISASAEKAADIRTKTAEMDEFLQKAYPDIAKENSEHAANIEKMVDWLHLSGHPFGKYLAVAALQLKQLPQLITKVREDAQKEVLGKTADEKRKAAIRNNTPGSSGKSDEAKTPALNAQQLETAKKLFGNNKKLIARYARMVGGSQDTVTANVN